VVFRILPRECGAKARSEGPRGNRALQRKADQMADNTALCFKDPAFLPRATISTAHAVCDPYTDPPSSRCSLGSAVACSPYRLKPL